jgi:uncharacterized membrane protein
MKKQYSRKVFICSAECNRVRRITTIGQGDEELLRTYNNESQKRSRQKKKVMKMFEQGKCSDSISDELKIPRDQVIDWITKKSKGE